MQPTDFTALSPGRLTPVDGAVAFVPAPLPDELPLDGPTTGLLGEAEHAVGRLAGATLDLVNPYLVASPLMRREAILSSRIEGTFSTPEQLALLEAGGLDLERGSGGQDTLEVHNYIRAMEYGLASPLPLSLRLIRELHRVLLEETRGDRAMAGEFRKTQNFIGSPGDTLASARYVPPPADEMRNCLHELEMRLNRDDERLPFLVKVAAVHYQFEAIHPFLDGNGRVGRLLIALMFVRSGRLSEPVTYLSAFFERHRQEYMDLLLDVSRRGAWMPWVRFFLHGVLESAVDGLHQARALLSLRQRYHDRFRADRSFGYLQTLIDDLFRTPAVTIARVAERLQVTPAAAAGHVRKLVEAGVLREATGRRRGRIFVAPQILAFMDNPSPPAAAAS